MSLNVSMDLAPFERINVCGYQGLRVTRLVDLGVADEVAGVARDLTPHLLRRLSSGRTEPYKAINTDLQAVSSR
jgi:lipoyl(octanoyl) transferase